ncbi:MAG: tRNA-guanine transglycosylase [Promethearchaeota archaeon]
MLNIHYSINKNSGLTHLGKIKLYNNKVLNTPLCWFGLSIIENQEFQLSVFKKAKIEAFLSNAYDLYYLDKLKKRKDLIKILQKIDIAHKMDSGGFQLMKNHNSERKLKLTPKMVLEKQLEFGCDLGVQLDVPFTPDLSKSEKMKRINKTIENLIITLKYLDRNNIKFSILPVIHTVSNDLYLLKYCIKKLINVIGENPTVIGIGSLVPLIKKIKGSKNYGIKNFIYSLVSLRKILPKTFIHAFGVGGTMSYLAILAGIDSFDSNGWIQKSAYGVIQLPGISDRFLKRESHNRPYLINNRRQRNCKEPINEIDIFMKCKCSACKSFYRENWNNSDWKKKQESFSGRTEKARLLRAIHNVSLYQNEIIEIRKAIHNGQLLEFVKDRLKFSIYYKYIDFIETLKSKDIEDLENIKDFTLN